MPTSISNFPQEIIDIIIDHLHADWRSLYTCTRVCQSWLTSSRHHLFRRFVVRGGHKSMYLKTISFLVRTPGVGACIQHLRVEDNIRIHVDEIGTLLRALPGLRTLCLSDVVVYGIPRGSTTTTTARTPRFRALDELQLVCCNLTRHTCRELFSFLGLFASLDRLELRASEPEQARVTPGADSDSDDDPADSERGPPPPAHLALAHLSTAHMPLAIVHSLVAHTRTQESLRALQFDDGRLGWAELDVLGGVFAALGAHRSLRRVVFGPLSVFQPAPPLAGSAEVVERWRALGLWRCPTLVEVGVQTSAVLRAHADFFAVAGGSVREARIVLVNRKSTLACPDEDCEWAAFDAACGHGGGEERLRRGARVVLDVSDAKERMWVVKYAELVRRAVEGMPILGAQNRLVVCEEPRREWWRGA